MCQAVPPGTSNPAARGAGNSMGSITDPIAQPATPYTAPTSDTTASGTIVPLGANAGLAASRAREGEDFGTRSFQDQGHLGVGTVNPGTGVATQPSGVGGIIPPRVMDGNGMLGSAITGNATGMAASTPPNPTPAALSPAPSVAAPSMELFAPALGNPGNPAPTSGYLTSPTAMAQAWGVPAGQPGFAERMAGPQGGAANVVNALMRRRSQSGYY